MPLLTGWPTYSDDLGDGQTGTVIDKPFLDAMKGSIEAQNHSAANPTVTPANIIDEVVQARGSRLSVDARLDEALNEDGSLKTPLSLVTIGQFQSTGIPNLIPNADLMLWSVSDLAAPDYFTVQGAGATIQRCGTGLADTTKPGYGDFCARVTYGTAQARLVHILINAAEFAATTGIRLRNVSFGAFVKSNQPNHCRIVVSDGVSSTASAFHSGGSLFEWVAVTHPISAAATLLQVEFQVNSAGAAYVGDFTGTLCEFAPSQFIPCIMTKHTLVWQYRGVVAVGANFDRYVPGAPGIVTDVHLYSLTAPTGAPLIVDVNTWGGFSFNSMFATPPQIAIAQNTGFAVPDGTYNRRCFAPSFGAIANGGMLSGDIDQVGSGVAGSDLTVSVRFRQYVRQLEGYVAWNRVA